MANPEHKTSTKPRRAPSPAERKQQRAEEAQREQAKTEVEERPYLDTEGGE
ncbi:MAG TPA: hypothetical protein VFP84_07295 [Kofleriaceae bacterium]|nr:hypothetical protein [Kofleriaceae bacterium]